MTKAFMSYVRADRELADRLYRVLTTAGIDVWHDVESVSFADNLVDQILNATRSSDFMVFVTPKFSHKAANALSELGAARALSTPIIPVVGKPGWYETADVANAVSHYAAIDAGKLSDTELTDAIIARIQQTPQVA